MLILSGSTPLYVLLLRGSGTPRYRPSSGRPSGGSSSTTISTLLIAARRSAGKELSASSIASSNGSLRPGFERASISATMPESVLGAMPIRKQPPYTGFASRDCRRQAPTGRHANPRLAGGSDDEAANTNRSGQERLLVEARPFGSTAMPGNRSCG